MRRTKTSRTNAAYECGYGAQLRGQPRPVGPVGNGVTVCVNGAFNRTIRPLTSAARDRSSSNDPP